MATLTTGVVLLRWQLLSAVMMFLASTLNIRFRRSDYVGLAVISSGLGVVSASSNFKKYVRKYCYGD